ncbi:hypothetical protein AAHC03_05029 [Spirometra sp. Aus1]
MMTSTAGGKIDLLQTLQLFNELRASEAAAVLQEEFHGACGLADLLSSSAVTGLKESQVAEQRRIFGENSVPRKPPKSIFRLIWEALQDLVLIILILAAFVSLALSLYMKYNEKFSNVAAPLEQDAGWIEGVAILVAVLVVVFVVAFNDWQKERQFRCLQDRIESRQKFTVVRDAEIKEIPIVDIVVGDICLIKYGDLLPADGVLIQSSDLTIDESSLTGEADRVRKGERTDPILLSGTHVMEGSGRMIVTAVGINSQAGIIYSLLNSMDVDTRTGHVVDRTVKWNEIRENGDLAESEEKITSTVVKSKPPKVKLRVKEMSVLQLKLTRLAIQIGYLGVAAAVATVVILVVKFCIFEFAQKREAWQTSRHLKQLIQFFIIGITVLVVAVPEGLPLAVTLSLAYSVKKMMKDNNLVRHLDACETMGNATAICCDKTGTLTTNRMTVVEAHIGEKVVLLSDLASGSSCHIIDSFVLSKLELAIALNSSYSSRLLPPKTAGAMPIQVGNKTECALLGFLRMLRKDYAAIRQNHPESEFLKVFAFTPIRKSMTTILQGDGGQSLLCLTKGAAEIIISRCSFMMNDRGNLTELTHEARLAYVRNRVEPMAKKGLRTIAIAYKEDPINSSKNLNVDDESAWAQGLVLLCVVGIEDPVRSEVPLSIRNCQRAGITVRMVTGDNIETAKSVALKCGILNGNTKDSQDVVMDGREFNRRIRDPVTGHVSQGLLDAVWPKLRVLARSSPQDKYMLVDGIIASHLHNNREVVAVTGDGTNDAPALKRADVGFAMGLTGTDVAKEASDIIITDDNFTSIVKAVMWGRNVYDSIAKFLQFQLTVNIVAVVVAFVGACFITDSPLKAVQMLWVNLIMDTLASLALATEMPTEELLKRAPYGRTKPLISRKIMKFILGQAIYQISVIFILLWAGEYILEVDDGRTLMERGVKAPTEHFTAIFNTFVMMTLFNEFNARKIHGERNAFSGLRRDVLFISIWIATFVIQVVIVQFGGFALNTKPLALDHWLWCLFFGFTTLLWSQVLISVPSSIIPRLSDVCFWTKRSRQRRSRKQMSHEIAAAATNPTVNVSDDQGLMETETEQQANKPASSVNAVIVENRSRLKPSIPDPPSIEIDSIFYVRANCYGSEDSRGFKHRHVVHLIWIDRVPFDVVFVILLSCVLDQAVLLLLNS